MERIIIQYCCTGLSTYRFRAALQSHYRKSRCTANLMSQTLSTNSLTGQYSTESATVWCHLLGSRRLKKPNSFVPSFQFSSRSSSFRLQIESLHALASMTLGSLPRTVADQKPPHICLGNICKRTWAWKPINNGLMTDGMVSVNLSLLLARFNSASASLTCGSLR